MNEKEHIMDYLLKKLNLDSTTYSLIEVVYDEIEGKWCGKTKIKIYNSIYEVNGYLPEFVKKLNKCGIDLSIYELIMYNIIEHK